MATTIDTVLDQVVTLLAGITVAGGYHYDLDGADQVALGRRAAPSRQAKACVDVADWRVRGSYDADLTSYRRILTFVLVGRVPTSADTPSSRSEAAAALLDDCIARLEANYTLGGNVLDMIVTDSGPIEGLEGEASTMAAFAAEVEVYWFATRGAGL